MGSIIQVRRDVAANWTSTNPTLAQGEMGHETDTGYMKIGTGIDVWTALPYFNTTLVEGGTLDGQTLRWETTSGAWEANSSLIVADSGNVGIGISSLETIGKLQVQSAAGGRAWVPPSTTVAFFESGSGTAQVDIISATTGSARINFGDDEAERSGSIEYTHSTNSLGFWANGGLRMSLTSLSLLFSASSNVIGTDTIDGADNKSLVLSGTSSTASGRGSWIRVNGNESNSGAITLQAGNAGGPIDFNTSGSTLRMRIAPTGLVAIGTTGASAQLRVRNISASTYISYFEDSADALVFGARQDGGLRAPPTYNKLGTGRDLQIDANGNIVAVSSSAKYKQDIEPYSKGLNELMRLTPVSYRGKGTNDDTKQLAGFLAEDIHAEGFTEFANYHDGKADSVRYGELVTLAVAAIQEQQAMLVELTAKVEALEARL